MMDGVAEYLVDFIGALGRARFPRPCLSAQPRHMAEPTASDNNAQAFVDSRK